MNRCPECGATKRRRLDLRCVCGADVIVEGQQPMFEEQEMPDERNDPTVSPGEDGGGDQIGLW